MMNRPFLTGDGGNAISTPHTLWSKNRFLSTHGKRVRFGGCAGGLSGIFVCCREVGSHGNLSHDQHGLGDWTAVSGGVSPGLVALEFDARLPGQQSIRPNP